MKGNLTYLIPTHNRSGFLRRLLYFMEQTSCQNEILLVDSSATDRLSENREIVALFSNRLNINHTYSPLDVIPKCRQALESVDTHFTVMCADDDFLMPSAVAQCQHFIENSSEYSCAQGTLVSLCNGKNNKCYVTPGYSIENQNPVDRFHRMGANWFSTFYSVYRTETLMRPWQVTDDRLDNERARIFPEFMLAQVSVLLGRVKYFPTLFNLREEHHLNGSLVIPEVADEENRDVLYGTFRAALSEELMAVSNMSAKLAGRLVDQYYGVYQKKPDPAYRKKIRVRLQRCLKRIAFQLIDAVNRGAVRTRRRLNPRNPDCSSDAWRLAYRLMVEYPVGMSADELAGETAERRAA
ncbi:MAG: TIGR00180 family glycosyltransferase [Planctomycetota bacterium]|nr:TIGR00180 family glycosyltransferase [Planctomycetota bacterium]